MEGRIRPIEQYVTSMASVFSENIIKTMSAEKTLLHCFRLFDDLEVNFGRSKQKRKFWFADVSEST